MKGTIKYYNRDRGFGFIAVMVGSDHFFHVSQLNGQDPPHVGDTVSFIPDLRDGKPIAKSVQITDRKALTTPKPTPNKRPYYGKPKYRTEWVPSSKPFKEVAPAAGLLGGIGWLLGGPLAGIIAAGIGAAIADTDRKQVEITSPCIRCGGTGQVTASVDGLTGFQCQKCRHFWKVKDEKLQSGNT